MDKLNAQKTSHNHTELYVKVTMRSKSNELFVFLFPVDD